MQLRAHWVLICFVIEVRKEGVLKPTKISHFQVVLAV